MLFRNHSFAYALPLTFILMGLFAGRVSSRKCLESVSDVTPRRFFQVENDILNITLETSSEFVGHQLVTNAFAIFLREVLGYDAVQVVTYSDLFNYHYSLAYERLAGHEYDGISDPVGDRPQENESIINLGFWARSEADLERWSISEKVERVGHLGFRGRFGWFIPRIPVVEENPDVDGWRGFTEAADDLNLTNLFTLDDDDYTNATTHLAWNPSTERFYCFRNYENESLCSNGAMYSPKICESQSSQPRRKCAILLASHPDSSSFLPEQIEQLGLRVEVLWLGPNLENFVHHLISKYKKLEGSQRKAVMFLDWSPTILTSEYDVISVSFPPCDYNTFCSYESRSLQKIVSSKLKVGAKLAYEAVHRLSFNYTEYKGLLDLYVAQTKDSLNQIPLGDEVNEIGSTSLTSWKAQTSSRTVETVACQWMQNSQSTWKTWKPHQESKKIPLYIGGIFPLSGSYTAKGLVIAANMATIAINSNTSSVLKDYDLRMHVYDGQCRTDKVMKSFIDYIRLPTFPHMAGVLGPACSDTAEPLAGVATHFKTVVISYSAEGSSFSDREKYPYFFRTIGENIQYKHVYLALLKEMGWKRVASLTEEGQKYAEYVSHLQDMLQRENIEFIMNRKFPKDALNMSQYLNDLNVPRSRIIIGDFYDNAARAVMCEAFRKKMTAREGYVWFLPVWFNRDWYDTDKYNSIPGNEYISCNTSEMVQAIDGHLSLQYAYYAPDEQLMQENITVGEWKANYKKACEEKSMPVETSDYAGYAYDAMWTYAYALEKLLQQNHSHITNLHSEKTTNTFVKIINNTDFYGLSGRIRFIGGSSRVSTVNIIQWFNGNTTIVGHFYPQTSNDSNEIINGTLVLNTTQIKWLTPDGSKPDDGSVPRPQCVLETLASTLGVTCEVAIVIANVIGFGILGFVLIVCFLIIKRRYDRKVQMTEDYFKALGIDILSATNVSALDKWEIPRDRVVINRKLGEGAFGTVYGGECFFDDKGWVAVAVKTLKVGSSCEQKLDFLSEAEVMKRFEHKNIVKLLGVCTKNEPVYTVMEFMLYGDLKTYLLARRHLVNEKNCEESDEISSRRLTSMSLDVARALSYLAELKYVHRDVACRNCLVNASRVVKLGDFGMTRPMYENDYYRFNRKGMLPVRWMAPESLALGIFTPMSDVWSFGVLLYEIITFGSFPFQGKSNNEVLEYVKSGNTVSIPSGVNNPKLEQLIKDCWQLDAGKRPHGAEIVEFLANNPRIVSPCLDIPLASVQLEGTDQLEISLPDRHRKAGSVGLKNGGARITKVVRTPGDVNSKDHFIVNEESIPLTHTKNCHIQSNGNTISHNSSSSTSPSAYVSLHHDPNSIEGELI